MMNDSEPIPVPADSEGAGLPVEPHPLEPFLPPHARLLMLGSFPPPRRRWSMEFFYPNLQNDMWRIVGLVFFGDRSRFLRSSGRGFDRAAIESFCRERGIALYDTAEAVVRLRDNASDNFLRVVRETDIETLLVRLPECRTVAVTGQKAADTLCRLLGCDPPSVGGWTECGAADRSLRLWRMPSSSRAYPLAVERKAEYYRRLFVSCGLL